MVLLVLTGMMAYLISTMTPITQTYDDRPKYLLFVGLAWVLTAVAVGVLHKLRGRWVGALVIIGTVLVAGSGMLNVPLTSTDSARYSWDGIVQKTGVSPYAYVPSDDALAALRPAWLFKTGAACGRQDYTSFEQTADGVICTEINRPGVPTIYPPVAEAAFFLARLPFAANIAYLPIQLLGFLSAIATTLLLLVGLRRHGRSPAWAALWGWSPFVALEAVNNAHIDALAVAFALAGTLLLARPAVRTGRRIWGGVLIGLGVATKFLPVLLIPPLLRRHPIQLGLTVVGTVALTYVPYVLMSGLGVLGYLPGYLNEEGYDNGSRSVLFTHIFPDKWTTLIALGLLALLALYLIFKTDPANPWLAQTVMVGSALILLSPRYGWYGLLLLPFIALSGRIEWLSVVLVLMYRQQNGTAVVFQELLFCAIVIILGSTLLRWLRTRRLRNEALWRIDLDPKPQWLPPAAQPIIKT